MFNVHAMIGCRAASGQCKYEFAVKENEIQAQHTTVQVILEKQIFPLRPSKGKLLLHLQQSNQRPTPNTDQGSHYTLRNNY